MRHENLDEIGGIHLPPMDLEKLKFSRIQKIETLQYTGKVYDLKMSGEPNYAVSGVIAHNGGGR